MPCLAQDLRVRGESKATTSWPGGVNGVGGKVKGHTIKTTVSREGRVEGPRAHVVEGELGSGDQVVRAVRGKDNVSGRKDCEDVIFGGTN